jgi:hypothetical protein
LSALATWLHEWQPIAINGAILAGARALRQWRARSARAVETAFNRWHDWAVQQREHVFGSRPGITAEEYSEVARSFTAIAGSRDSCTGDVTG